MLKKIKAEIERRTEVQLKINSEIELEGEPLAIQSAENVIRAIGRGFSPENAFKLLSEDTCLLIIQLPGTDRALTRLRSRLIGKRGRARANLERLSGCDVSIYGKTVAIIGQHDAAYAALMAVEKLIQGSSHAAAWAALERRMAKIRRGE